MSVKCGAVERCLRLRRQLGRRSDSPLTFRQTRVRRSDYPLREVGTLTLDRLPANFFAEVRETGLGLVEATHCRRFSQRRRIT